MKLNNDMLFAHPVLAYASTDYTEGLFDADFTVTIGEKDNLDISASMTLNCPDLIGLLDSGAAGSGFFLICAQTYDNRLVEMAPGTKQYRFSASDFFGTVRVRPVVWSKEERKQWRSTYLHPEYQGVVDLPPAAILAVGEEQTFSVDRERLKPFESIFRLAALDDLSPGEIAVDAEGDKITIKVNSATKESIEGIRNNGTGRSFLLNAVYFPAVMQVLGEIANDPRRHERWAWFRIFQAKCAAEGINIENPDALRDAQRLLRFPFLKIDAEKERLFV